MIKSNVAINIADKSISKLSSAVSDAILQGKRATGILETVEKDIAVITTKQSKNSVNTDSTMQKAWKRIRSMFKKKENTEQNAKLTTPQQKAIKEDNFTAKAKEFIKDTKTKIKKKIQGIKKAAAESTEKNISKLKAYKTSALVECSFEQFKQAVDNNPVIRFIKELIKKEDTKVKQSIVSFFNECKCDYEYREKQFKKAQEEFNEKLKAMEKAIADGSPALIDKAKKALNYAKESMHTAKNYLEIAAKYFESSSARVSDLNNAAK